MINIKRETVKVVTITYGSDTPKEDVQKVIDRLHKKYRRVISVFSGPRLNKGGFRIIRGRYKNVLHCLGPKAFGHSNNCRCMDCQEKRDYE